MTRPPVVPATGDPFGGDEVERFGRRKGAAELADRVVKRLDRDAEEMAKECLHKPCDHAAMLRIAADAVRHEFARYANQVAEEMRHG